MNTIRGIAALMVAVYHAPPVFGVQSILPHAYLAVDLFFALSGFVMMHVYEPRIRQGMSFARFAQLRLARLYPLLVLASLAGFGFWCLKVHFHMALFGWARVEALPRNLMMIPASPAAESGHTAFPFVVQSWSIGWELLLCALFYPWLRWLGRGALIIALVVGGLMAVVAVRHGGLDVGWSTDTFWLGIVRALFAFFAGVAVRQVSVGATRAPLALNLAAIALCAAVLGYVIFIPKMPWWADYSCAVVAFPVILAAASLCRSRWIENPAGDFLGQASYSVYMLHAVAIDVIGTILRKLRPLSGPEHIALDLSWLVALLLGSWLCWRYVEMPLRRYFSRSPRRHLSTPEAGASGWRPQVITSTKLEG